MFSIGTYNIQKPDEAWQNREPKIIENIVQADLDVVTLQEVCDLPSHQEFLKEKLAAHGYAVSRHTEKPGQTALGVAWKTERFELLKSFTGTYTNGADRKRCFSAVDLKDKIANKVIRVASIHLYTAPRDGTEHLGIAQLRTFRELLEREPGAISRLIIAGDFNADFERGEDAAVLNLLAQKRDGSDYAYHTIERDASGKKILTKGRNKLDWVFVGVKSEAAALAPKVSPHVFKLAHPNASDHFMHAVNVHDEDVPFVQRAAKQVPIKVSDEITKKLRECFSQKERLVRDDLIRAGLVTRDDCNQKTSEWARQRLILQQGRGRETCYLRGQALNDAVPSPAMRQEAMPEILRNLLERNGRITRQDVMNTGLEKLAAEAKITRWIAAGLLVKQGHGRDTVYILPQRVADRPSLEPNNHTTEEEIFINIGRVFGQFLGALASGFADMLGHCQGRPDRVHTPRTHPPSQACTYETGR